METLQLLLQYLLHIDDYLLNFVSHYGALTYLLLFLIIFCETGLVIMPFLPGDSLLFAAGSIAAHESEPLSLSLLMGTLIVASILGNKTNYLIGKAVGPCIFVNTEQSSILAKLLNKQHLQRAHHFYERHGGKTIIFARFLPIIRSFAPFVAGASHMNLASFSFYNIVSALLWILSLCFSGYFFGSLPFIQEHFSLVIYSIIGISLLPPLCAFFYSQIHLSIERQRKTS